MAIERFTISCDECSQADSPACADCVVTFVVGAVGSAGEKTAGGTGRHAGRVGPARTSGSGWCSSAGLHPARSSAGTATEGSPGSVAERPAGGSPPEPADARAGRLRVLELSASEAAAVQTLATAGLVPDLRFRRRAS